MNNQNPPRQQQPMSHFPNHPYAATPPAHNPSLRVFNPYSAGNSPTNIPTQHTGPYVDSNYDDDGFDDRTNDHDHDHDHDHDQTQGDPKRRRIARACDMCRKKKIKCDGKMPKCSHCQNYKTECIFTQVEKKRQPPKGAKYIEGLENRLARMEGLLKMSGLLGEDDGGKTDLGTLEKRLADRQVTGSAFASPASPHITGDGTMSAQPTPPTGITSPQPGATHDVQGQPPADKASEGLADQMCSLVTNTAGETRYIGSSSGFSIFSPKGIQWVNEKTGDSSFRDMISQAATDDRAWAVWKPQIFDDIFSRKVYKPLPSKSEALVLLRDFFDNFNCVFPLFHEPTFMHLVDKHYSLEPYEGSGWWASLNVALAIAHRLRVIGEENAQVEDAKAWSYLKNALAVLPELTMRNNDLLSVQALLGMALFMQGTPNPQPGFFLVAAALRLAHSIGLHKRGSDFNLNEIESEQRKRVFWIGYLMDKDICLRSGRPPVQDDDDMNVELPSENPPDNIGVVPIENGQSKVNLFRIQCVFAMIQSKVYKQLYSVKAARQTDGELLNTIGDLDQELEEWKDSIPLEFRPEHEIKVAHPPLRLHIVVMHFAYYNCLTTIHRMSVHHGYWTSRLSNYAIAGLNARPLNPRVFMSAALCVNAARTSISLVKFIPSQDHACVWLLVYYPVSALVTLFANILQNPQDARARSDLKLMNSMTEFLHMLCSEDPNVHCRRMASICKEFERIARVALDKAERDIKGRGKRKSRETDSQEQAPQPAQPQRRAVSQPNQAQAQQTPNMSTSSLPSKRKATASPSVRHDEQTNKQPYQQPGLGPMPFSTSSNSSPYPATTGIPSHNWMGSVAPPQENMFTPDNSFPPATFPQDNFDMQGYGAMGQMNSEIAGSFQQPFVPQDLWQMPMTLEWDWADFFGAGPGFDLNHGVGLNDPSLGGPSGGQ